MGTGLGTWGAALGNKGSLRLMHGATLGGNPPPVNCRLAWSPERWRFGAGLGRREAQNKLVARLNDMGVQPREFSRGKAAQQRGPTLVGVDLRLARRSGGWGGMGW